MFAPCESAMLSLEMKLRQKHGPVSCTLIKQSSFIVAPRSLLFSQKLKEQAAAKLQPSCQLDKSQFISVTRQQGPSSSQARGGRAVETCSLQSLCQRGPLARVIPSAVVYLPVYLCKHRSAQLVHHLHFAWKKEQNQILGYVADCRISFSPQLTTLLPSLLSSFLLPPFHLFSLPPSLVSFP